MRPTKKNKKQLDEEKKIIKVKESLKFWLYKTYEIQHIPDQFFKKLEQVYDGTYKDLSRPIPIEDLYDMWQRKMPYLLQTYDSNVRKGKNIEGTQRLNYDLSILLSKYDSYLKWKEEQKQIQIEKEQRENEIKIDYSNMFRQQPLQNSKLDINSIIDEI